MSEPDSVKSTRPADVETSPSGIVKRWIAELDLADGEEKDWREESKKLWEQYEGKHRKADSFNILWSNTETLAPALYNTTPQPDVRRRFKDADPIGKHVSKIIERALSYQIDAYDFDDEIKAGVLDALICGRWVSRIKYTPVFGAPPLPPAPGAPPEDGTPSERVVDETVECEHVQWDKFRRGPGRTWREVTWVSFEHAYTRDMAEQQFGPEIAARLKFSKSGDSERIKDKDARSMFETCTIYEVWDKDSRRVLFISVELKSGPCAMVADPLQLTGFFPIPRPVYAIQNSRTLVPAPLYRMYAEQAKELDRISGRINVVTKALRLRGAYIANIAELKDIIEGDDRSMIPITNISEIAAAGGLDKAIWIMPTEKLIGVLRGLYEAREQAKQVIYEIGGLSDILRGATDANETATAQRIKNQWGSVRIRKLQREAQRMVRDLMRLKAEVICQTFGPETLAAQTNVQLPTGEQKAQAQMLAQQAQAMQQPIDPQAQQMLSLPSWDEVMQVMRSDALRTYRVDVETDSTVADTMDPELSGITEVVRSLGEVFNGAAQGMQAGIIPVEVPKEISLAIVRRARMGMAVEDAIEKIEPPQAPPSPTEQEMRALQGARETLMATAKQAVVPQMRAEQQAADDSARVDQIAQQGQQAAQQVQAELAEIRAMLTTLVNAVARAA